jgi:hypothetical protein
MAQIFWIESISEQLDQATDMITEICPQLIFRLEEACVNILNVASRNA